MGKALGFTDREAGTIGFWAFFGFGALMGLLALRLVIRLQRARRDLESSTPAAPGKGQR